MEDTEKKKYNRFNSDNKTWILFYILVILTFFLAKSFPKATEITDASDHDCISRIYEELDYPCIPFDFDENPVYAIEVNSEVKNPFSVLAARPRRRSTVLASFVILRAEVSLFVVDNNYEIIDRVFLRKSIGHIVECNDENIFCETMEVGSVQYSMEGKYIFVLSFYNMDKVRAAHISEIDLYLINITASYSFYMTILHYMLLISGAIWWYRLVKVTRNEKFAGDDLNSLILFGYSLIALNNPFSYWTYMERSFTFTTIGNLGIAIGSTFFLNYLDAYANRLLKSSGSKLFKTICLIFFVLVVLSSRKGLEHHIESRNYIVSRWISRILNFMELISGIVKLSALIFVLRKYLKIMKEQNLFPKERTGLIISSFFLIILMILIFTDCLMIDLYSSEKNIYFLCFINFYFLIMARLKLIEEESMSFKRIDQSLEDGKSV